MRGGLKGKVDNKRFPLWANNLFVFLLLFLVIITYFLWQIHKAKKDFLDHVNEQAQLVAGVVQLNIKGSVFSQGVTEEILQSFLSNTARFIDYLDSIEPFTLAELTAFAGEAGLAGIMIYTNKGRIVEGPPEWSKDFFSGCNTKAHLKHLPGKHLYLFSSPRQAGEGCVLIGLNATNIESMQQQLGLSRLTETLSELPGICYASMEHHPREETGSAAEPEIIMLKNNGSQVAEVHLFINKTEITVGMCTTYLELSLHRLWRDFFIFSTALALLGTLLTFILYRLQSSYLSQVRNYERQISRQREDATLGRAAASIAHEIRNPLNAIKMGLQRLQIEGQEIGPDHKHLVGLMLDAVRRTNDIVSGLLNYARPQSPKQHSLRFDLLLQKVLSLYLPQCKELNIHITQNIDFHGHISGDPDLLQQAIENLLKNAVEAQHNGGSLSLELGQKGMEVFFRLRNSGFTLPPEQADRIMEPYFTTKTDGTGLGLSITRRIIQAHKGRIEARCPEKGSVEITVYLPKEQE